MPRHANTAATATIETGFTTVCDMHNQALPQKSGKKSHPMFLWIGE
jgi:hypothetical protein